MQKRFASDGSNFAIAEEADKRQRSDYLFDAGCIMIGNSEEAAPTPIAGAE